METYFTCRPGAHTGQLLEVLPRPLLDEGARVGGGVLRRERRRQSLVHYVDEEEAEEDVEEDQDRPPRGERLRSDDSVNNQLWFIDL